MNGKRILIIEDEEIIRNSVKKLLIRHHYDAETACTVSDAESKDIASFDLIITDQRLPGEQGTVLIGRYPDKPILVMTSYASLRTAVDTMRLGAADYISKPFDQQDLIQTVKRILDKSPKQKYHTKETWIAHSAAMANVNAITESTTNTALPTLISGGVATGKSTLANIIRVNSELFSKQSRQFHCGLHQDEIISTIPTLGSQRYIIVLEALEMLPSANQDALAALLSSDDTLLQRIKFISTTGVDLEDKVKQQDFSAELYYRLNELHIHLPPLRDREGDIEKIANAHLSRLQQRVGKTLSLTKEAVSTLKQLSWKGNIRELQNSLNRAAATTKDGSISSEELINHCSQPTNSASLRTETSKPESKGLPKMTLEQYFTQFVLENQNTMSETELASQLGISRKSLWERRQRLGITRNKDE